MSNFKVNQNPLVSVITLVYNEIKFKEKFLDSLKNQDYSNIEVIMINNASTDDSKKRIFQWLQINDNKTGITYKWIDNENNIGFAAGQNQGIIASKGEYILCLNQDAWLDRYYIKNAIAVLKKDKKVASVQGKLIRFDFQNDKILDIIDTTGLVMLKNRRIINRGQGIICCAEEKRQNKIEEIFGPDGAAPVYKRTALEDVKLPRTEKKSIDQNNSMEYFDEDFFIYKEDVDLAWRLRLYGWKNLFVEKCIAYHGRGAGDSAAVSALKIIEERRNISPLAKYYSWKNQRLMQIKNENINIFLKHLPWFLPKEIASWVYVLLFEEPQAIKSIVQMFLQLPAALKKRKIIMLRKKATNKEIKNWFK